MESLRDIPIIFINILIPSALFLAWIIAELRWRAGLRICLALACMFFLFYEIWLTDTLSDLQVQKHQFILQHIEILLQNGKKEPILKALRIYDETYKETHSAKDAAKKMDLFLQEYENEISPNSG